MQNDIETGLVKFFNKERSYGFILLNSGDRDVYFHSDNGRRVSVGINGLYFSAEKLARDPQPGDKVAFKKHYGEKGTEAIVWGLMNDFKCSCKMIKDNGTELMTHEYINSSKNWTKLVVRDNNVTTCGVPCYEFEEVTKRNRKFQSSSTLLCSKDKLLSLLKHPLPEQMKKDLCEGFSIYYKEMEQRQLLLLDYLHEITKDKEVKMDDVYMYHCKSLLELENDNSYSALLKEIYKNKHLTGIFQKYYKPKTLRYLWPFYEEVFSNGPFLEWGEHLSVIVEKDADKLKKLGYNKYKIENRLNSILEGRIFNFRVYEGRQLKEPHCPYKGCKHQHVVPTRHLIDFSIVNTAIDEQIVISGLMVHLIFDHGFFGGQNSPYRVDPEQLIRVLFSEWPSNN